MANKSFVVQYLIKARDAYSAKVEKIAKAMANVDRQNKKATKSAGKLNKVLKKTGAGLMAAARKMKFAALAIVAGVVAAAGATLLVGSRFESAMADLSAITGATGKDLDFLKKKALELAKTTITNQDGIAAAMKLVASAKPDLLKDLPALVKTTEQVLLLKNAGTELEIAAMAVAGGLNTFGRGAEFAGRFVNILAAGSKLGSSEIGNTSEAVKIAGPGARAAGLSFLQLNAAIQTVAKGSIFGSQAGTALNAIFGRLRRSGRDFQRLGLEGAFQSVKDELDAIKDPTLRAIAEAKIFGDEHSKVGLAILNNIGYLGRYERELKGTTVAQEQADIRLKTFAKTMSKLKIILQDKLIKLFERIKPLIVDAAGKLGDWLDSLDDKKIDRFATSLMSALRVIFDITKGLADIGSFLFGKSDIDKASAILKQQGKTAAQIQLFENQARVGMNRSEVALLAAKYDITSPFEASTLQQSSAVDVNVNVGLDDGLQQTTKPKVSSFGTRRADVGFAQ